ncbi:hypothetical protein MOS72_001499 [Salmonella enterica]|nr:hypothetical protein [Salmonella enterica]
MNQKPEMDLAKAEALGAMQMKSQQIACAMDIDLNKLREDNLWVRRRPGSASAMLTSCFRKTRTG